MPSAFETFKPFSSLASGFGTGQDLVGRSQQIGARQVELENLRGRQSALANYAQTKDPTELLKYDPELVMKMNEQQARRAQEGVEMTYKMAPFLMQNAGDPRVWEEAAKDLERYGAPKAITSMLRTGSPQERVAAFQGVLKTADNLKADLFKRQTEITSAAQKDVGGWQYKNITEPQMKLQAGLQKDLHLTMQDNAEKLKEKYAKIADKREIPKQILTDLTKIRGYIIGERSKVEPKIREQFQYMRPGPGQTQADIDRMEEEAVRKFRAGQAADLNEAIELMRPIADQYGVKLPAKEQEPEAIKAVNGPPPGSDLNFDKHKALIDAMPAGPAKDAKMKQLIERWKELQG